MLQHGGFTYEVENVLEKSTSFSQLSASDMNRSRGHNKNYYSSSECSETEDVEDEEMDRNQTALMLAFDELYENLEEQEAD